MVEPRKLNLSSLLDLLDLLSLYVLTKGCTDIGASAKMGTLSFECAKFGACAEVGACAKTGDFIISNCMGPPSRCMPPGGIKVAVLPLSKKQSLTPLAKDIYNELRKHFMTQYDESQSIGRRYRRQDEIGTPYCVTVDFQSIKINR